MNRNEYKNAMDKIVISDELREKIINNSSEKHKRIYVRNNIYGNLKRAAKLAACFAFCVLSYYAYTNYSAFPAREPVNTATSPEKKQHIQDELPNDNKEAAAITTMPDNAPNKDSAAKRKKPADKAAVPKEKGNTQENTTSSDPNIDSAHQTQPQGNAAASSDIENIAEKDAPSLSESLTGGSNVLTSEINAAGSVGLDCAESNDCSIERINKELGYNVKTPKYIPDGYKYDNSSVPFGGFAQIIYTNGTNNIYYRTAKTTEDISGDYNSYTETETFDIEGSIVTIKGNNNLFNNAGWFKGEEAFSIYSDIGLEREVLADIVKSVN